MAVALIEHQAGGLSFELGRKRTTLLGRQAPLYGEHSRPKWVSGISRPLHLCGSCAMGSDPALSVVDKRLKVHGIDSLRVVDASIFPNVTSGNTNAAAMMVAEKGADLILADA